jgi:phosphate transport system protein
MERHREQELQELRQRLLWMGSLAERAVHQAVRALIESDIRLADTVVEEEAEINSLQIEIDERALRLLALQQPMAVDLRMITAAMKINGDLERIGDQAVNIAQCVHFLLQYPQVKPYIDIPRMSDIAEGMMKQALDSFVRRDVELAKQVLLRDETVDQLRDHLFHELLAYMMEKPSVVFPAFQLTLVTRNLERVADHATNIAEDVIYMVLGQDIRHHALDKR